MEYRPALQVAVDAALEAGELLRQEFHRPGGPRGEGGHAEIDEIAEAAIRTRLRNAFPEFGMIGEELRVQDRPSRDPAKHLWLIDPNDGTAAYLQGHRGSAVSIGLLRSGVPVLGVVYAFGAPNDRGDLFAWAEGESFTRNGQVVSRAAWPAELRPEHTVLVSQAADNNSAANLACVSPARFRSVPSIAYRLALVAAGEADACVSLNGPCGWDYAAGHALVRAVGGELLDDSGQPVHYSVEGASGCGGVCYGGALAIAARLVNVDWSSVFNKPATDPCPFKLATPQHGRTIADRELLERAQGCLLGQLVGDAIGGLVEFSGPEEIAMKYPNGVRALHDGGHWGTLGGQPTDDSELALMLARSLVAEGRFSLSAIARAYVYWLKTGPFDIGFTIRTALIAAALIAAARSGREGQETAEGALALANPSSQANGALMRISPLAIFGSALTADALAEQARQDARLTHPHQVCQDANAVFAVAIQRALQGGVAPSQLYAGTLQWAQQADIHPDILETLRAAADRPPGSYTEQMGWVRTALQNAFYQLLHSDSLEAGVVDTVQRGGDTDTNGAIAGALLGAAHGLSAIPRQWLDRVLTCRPIAKLSPTRHPRPRAFWPVDALYLAEHLLLAGGAKNVPPTE